MVTVWFAVEPLNDEGLRDVMVGAGAVTTRFEVADVLPSGFRTCSVQVRTVVPTFTATAMEVPVTVAGVREVVAPPA